MGAHHAPDSEQILIDGTLVRPLSMAPAQKGSTQNQAIARSSGGLTMKIIISGAGARVRRAPKEGILFRRPMIAGIRHQTLLLSFSPSSTSRALTLSVRLTFPIPKAPQSIEASLGGKSLAETLGQTEVPIPAAICELPYPRK
jgi:hypothetical protein